MQIKRNAVILGLACVVAANAAGLRAQSTSGEKVKNDVKQTTNDVNTYVGEKKADYEKRIKVELDELGAKIDQLNNKMSNLGQEGKKKGQAQLKELKKKRRIAGMRFHKVKASSDKEWEKFKVGVDAAVNDLKKAYEDFTADLK
jgi:hypothetical protein